MKKWNGKKLIVHRETLRNLSGRELQDVEGGGTTGCSGTSSGSGCTATLVSDCHCGTTTC